MIADGNKKIGWFYKSNFKVLGNGAVWFYPWGRLFRGYEVKSEKSFLKLKKSLNVCRILSLAIIALWIVFIQYRIMDLILFSSLVADYLFLKRVLKKHTKSA